jgi:hypothetical protein
MPTMLWMPACAMVNLLLCYDVQMQLGGTSAQLWSENRSSRKAA